VCHGFFWFGGKNGGKIALEIAPTSAARGSVAGLGSPPSARTTRRLGYKMQRGARCLSRCGWWAQVTASLAAD